jgi:hypothetical protein
MAVFVAKLLTSWRWNSPTPEDHPVYQGGRKYTEGNRDRQCKMLSN